MKRKLNKSIVKHSSLLTIVTALFSLMIFVFSTISSVCFFGDDTSGIISNCRIITMKDKSEALITSFEIGNKKLDEWESVKEEYSSAEKYSSSVMKYHTLSFNNFEIKIIEIPPVSYDQYYSLAHVYCGDSGSWNLLNSENSIIISKHTKNKLGINVGDSIYFSSCDATYTIVGICDGIIGGDRSLTGNILSDLYGCCGFVAENSMAIPEDGYLQRIQTKMTNREFSFAFEKWHNLKKKFNFSEKISSSELQNKLNFCEKLKENKVKYFFGVFSILLVSTTTFIYYYLFVKRKFLFDLEEISLSSSWLVLIVFVFVWFVGIMLSRGVKIAMGGASVFLPEINSYSLSSLLMILCGLYFAISVAKKMKHHFKSFESEGENNYYMDI